MHLPISHKKKQFSWATIPFLRFLTFLVAGILLQVHLNLYTPLLLYIWLGCLLLYALLYFFVLPQKPYFVLFANGFLANISLLLFGIIHTYFYTAKNNPKHLIHEKEPIEAYLATIDSEIQEKKKSYKAEVEVSQILVRNAWKPACGRVVLYVEKEENYKNIFRYGDKILVNGTPHPATQAPNPKQFDYSAYLYFQNIYHLHRIKRDKVHFLSHSTPNYVVAWAIACREFFKEKFNQLVRTPQEAGLTAALLLGIKDGLDNEIIEAYSNTGTMHVLAVSGMHVSYLFFAIGFLFGFLKQNRKYEWLFVLISLFLLWFYAFVTGLSASVLRAVTMFSFLIIRQSLRRHTNFYNIMALSAVLLLCWQPFLLFQVGFLLSYLAVVGIVYYQPKIDRLFSPKNQFLAHIWTITTVSIAAQIATSPISLLYFHQFPNYFLLSNIVVIPLSAAVMYCGIALMAVCSIPWVNMVVGEIMRGLVWFMNLCIFSIEKLPYALTQGLDISVGQTVLLYVFLFFFSAFWFESKRFSHLVLSFVCLLVISSLQVKEVLAQSTQQELMVYNVHGHSVLANIKGQNAQVLSSVDLKKEYDIQKNSILPYLYYKGISPKNIHYQALPFKEKEKYTVIIFKNEKILWVREKLRMNEWQKILASQPTYVLISQNAFPYEIETWKTYFQALPQGIILDTSNTPFKAKVFSQQAVELGMKVFLVAEKAFVIT
ncbi:MAG: ComEC family competence protein [Microscillaceae bacterium]|nr:ComEC family competence protein [Microscillaceae bacterium]MDW8460040.1 ComEC/Rec2 family competence protein [Cytophagales bacterium]